MSQASASLLLDHPLGTQLLARLQPGGEPFSLIMLTYQDPAQRSQLLEQLVEQTADQLKHVLLQLAETEVRQLSETIEQRLADLLALDAAEAVQHAVHVVNLENSLVYEILAEQSGLLARLEEEHEALVAGYPFGQIWWLDGYTTRRLAHEAPQLWQGISLHVDFRDEAVAERDMGQDYLRLMEWAADEQARAKPEEKQAIAEVLYQREMHQQAQAMYQELVAGEDTALATRMAAHEGLGQIAQVRQDLGTALAEFEAALCLAEAPADQARLQERIGAAHQAMGESDAAIRYLEQARAGYLEVAQARGGSQVLRRLGHLLERKGKLDRAAGYYVEAGEQLAQVEPLDQAGLAFVWQQAGAIRQNQQRYAEALAAFQQALHHAQQTEDEFLTHALEDSVEDMEELSQKMSKGKSEGKKGKKKGFLGLFG